MGKSKINRRKFLADASIGTIAAVTSGGIPIYGNINKKASKLAILGGEPIRDKTKRFHNWRKGDENVIKSVIATTKSGIWSRIQSKTGTVPTFEKKFAELIGTKYCLTTGSGTQALHTALSALGIGGGDEVLLPPYTDVGTATAVFRTNALGVFVDIEIDSFQIDPDKLEEKINKNTKAILPVYIMGQHANMDKIMAVAKKHNLLVIEDACQAHHSVYKGKNAGTIGDLGCFSFQASKVLACGEGGAVVGNDKEIIDKCFAFHNHGSWGGVSTIIGPKYRMNEFEAAVLLGQMEGKGLQERAERRNKNADYLRSKIKDIPGIYPQKLYDGTTKGSYYCYGFRYLKEYFNDVPRDKFFKAARAEGISLSGYIGGLLNKGEALKKTLNSATFKKLYSKQRMKRYWEENECPVNDKLCKGDIMANSGGTRLLGTKEDMDDIANVILKIYENRDQLSHI